MEVVEVWRAYDKDKNLDQVRNIHLTLFDLNFDWSEGNPIKEIKFWKDELSLKFLDGAFLQLRD